MSYTGGVGDPTYQWYQSINGATAEQTGTNSPTYNPGILNEGNYQYYVEITFNDNWIMVVI